MTRPGRGLSMAEEGCELLRAAGVQASPAAVEGAGAVWRTILAEAADRDAAIVVLGSRGITGVRSLVLGSVSHGVANHCQPAGADHPLQSRTERLRARPHGRRAKRRRVQPAGPAYTRPRRASVWLHGGTARERGRAAVLDQPAVVRSRWRPAWVSGAGRRARSSVLRSAGTGIGHEVSAACGSGSGSGSGSATASGSGAGSAIASGAGWGSGTTDAGVATGSAGTAARPASP